MNRLGTVLCAVLTWTLVAAPALAFSPVLTPAETQAAIEQGRGAAAAHLGYDAAGYLLYSVPNTLLLAPGQGSVDAVIVGTPFERVTYASYLAAFQDSTASSDAVATAAAPDTVDFVVFAHSADPKDQAFLRRFRSASVTVAGHVLPSASQTVFGPAEDFYTTSQGKRVPRWLGYGSFRFDLRTLATAGVDISRLKGTFGVIDPYGRHYSFAFDLSKYR